MVAFCENVPTRSTATHFFCERRHSRSSAPKSKWQAELPVTNYGEGDRLESCSRDPIDYRGSKWNLFEYVVSSPVSYMDPSGLEVTIAACSERLREAISTRLPAKCKDTRLRSIRCNNESREPSGGVRCNPDTGELMVRISIGNIRSLSSLQRLIDHEVQHMIDLCTCGCHLTRTSDDEPASDHCFNIACMEIRACAVADCAGMTGGERRDCVRECAVGSVEFSERCGENANDWVQDAIATCLPPEGNQPGVFPNTSSTIRHD